MRVVYFSCIDLNSFITRKVEFFEDVSFLHGINGSGKTTILRAIASLLTPDPIWLANALFSRIEVQIEHTEKRFLISATKDGPRLLVEVSGGVALSGSLNIEEIRRLGEPAEDEFYRLTIDGESPTVTAKVRALIETNDALEFVSALPTPIFLGLDRTTLSPSSKGLLSRNIPRARAIHPYFRTQLDDAIFEAERLLTRQLALLSSERNRIFALLRNQLVLSSFVVPEPTFANSPAEIDELTQQLETIQLPVVAALEKINIGKEDIAEKVRPFFKNALALAKNAADGYREVNKIQKSNKPNTSEVTTLYVDKIIPFMNLLPSISIIMNTLSNIEDANTSERILSRSIETYQSIMESFFGDSGKTLILQENSIKVQLPTKNIADLTSLSSGERQIFVLITHLFFNPAIRGENILLIDEPELSLHLKWQRQFVTAIRQASPSTQMILATHSPEMVYNRQDNLISLDVQ